MNDDDDYDDGDDTNTDYLLATYYVERCMSVKCC